jgi:hypothetical protein
MKRLMLAILTGFFPIYLNAESGGGSIFSRDAEAVEYTKTIDVGDYERFSMQVNYADAAPATSTISDGAFASATLTVANYAALDGAAAYATITLESGQEAGADNAIITYRGRAFTEGIDWTYDAVTSTNTMESLKVALDARADIVATRTDNVITITAAYGVGTYANAWTLTTSTAAALSLSGATMTDSVPYGAFSINGVTLTEGTNWNALTSSATTAGNISAAINANTSLSSLVTASTTSLGVVTVISKTSGNYNYPISVSNTAYLTPSKLAVTGGSSSDINVAADSFTEASHGFSTGLALLYTTVSGTAPTGLTDQTTYYAIPVNANSFQLSDTSTGAVAGLEIDITAVTGSGSFTFAPLSFVAGSTGFKWQGSNDGTNFVDLSVSSVTYSADGNALWSFTDYAYKLIRFFFTAPTSGGMDLDGIIHWRKD